MYDSDLYRHQHHGRDEIHSRDIRRPMLDGVTEFEKVMGFTQDI